MAERACEMRELIEIQNVFRTYVDDKENQVEALFDVNLSVREGEFISIIGPSGCGKTTLLRLLAGLDAPTSGALSINGHEIKSPDPERGYVFQQGSLFPWLTVEKNIASGLKARGVYQKQKQDISHYIQLIGLAGFEKSYPHQISGGMAQRVAIARALINRPAALLLDEPMGALDSFTRADLQEKLLELWKKNHTTMILVTHDVDEAIFLSDRIVIMTPRPGQISEILKIDLPRPRDRAGIDFAGIRSSILEKLHLASTRQPPEYEI
ncbi:ABC transporter ATP-binding protein [Anoxybacterium hadale]|uniref:ABC transporter ATP-binding protein n=1 Tax=Anoxybacterium hadale TaxID=3408580 RepID=A0ACD1A9T2_9FIRM|nr:ABC transporter ATP-binding protein [Clostridiales bacterium]